MAKLQIVDGSKFTWKGTHGTSEASDLLFKDWPASFYIMSPKTGQQKLFLQGEAKRCGTEDNELQSVDYFNPGGGITVTIFND